jgi:hypothetical protein
VAKIVKKLSELNEAAYVPEHDFKIGDSVRLKTGFHATYKKDDNREIKVNTQVTDNFMLIAYRNMEYELVYKNRGTCKIKPIAESLEKEKQRLKIPVFYDTDSNLRRDFFESLGKTLTVHMKYLTVTDHGAGEYTDEEFIQLGRALSIKYNLVLARFPSDGKTCYNVYGGYALSPMSEVVLVGDSEKQGIGLICVSPEHAEILKSAIEKKLGDFSVLTLSGRKIESLSIVKRSSKAGLLMKYTRVMLDAWIKDTLGKSAEKIIEDFRGGSMSSDIGIT